MKGNIPIMDDALEINRQIDFLRGTQSKRTRIRQALLAISIMGFGAFYWSGASGDDRFLGLFSFPDQLSYLISGLFILVNIGLFTYYYVQGEPFIESYKFVKGRDPAAEFTTAASERLDQIELKMADLSDQLAKLEPKNDDLVTEISEAVRDKAYREIWSELTELVSEEAHRERAISPVQGHYESARERLLDEVHALGRRGTVNLVFGVLTTLAALGVLLSLAVDSVSADTYKLIAPSGSPNAVALALMFVPKLSLAVFVQVFSLFFLRLYRSGLSEIKYFQNELTNLEAKYLGMVSAVVSGDEEAVRDASKALLAVERNHVLTKGQTTIELEKHKIEQRSSAEILKYLPAIFGKK